MTANLNEQQRKAVEIVDKPSLVLAGAGSGKTRVLVTKVVHFITNHQVDPRSIVMITFTNKAAREMKDRIQMYLPDVSQSTLGFVGTFHAFSSYLLRRDGHYIGIDSTFSIFDTNDAKTLMKNVLTEMNIKTKMTPAYFLNRISEAKNQLVSPEKYLEVFSFYRADQVAAVYENYQKELRNNQAVDFDDLIMQATRLLTLHAKVLTKYQERFKYMLVDEFQDTNYAQYVLTRLLAKSHQRITAVGDFSQSIYSWRGADIRNLEKFTEDFPDCVTIKLEQNYRSTQTILDFAYEVISQNETHPILHLKTSNSLGSDIIYHDGESDEEEALYVARELENISTFEGFTFEQCAVLYRTNAQSRAVEEVFLHYGIPYTLIGGIRFYERKEIKDILSYLRLFIHPDDKIALNRVQKIGKRRWQKFKDLYQTDPHMYETVPTNNIIESIFKSTGYLDIYNPDVSEDFERIENLKELKSVAESYPRLVDFLQQVALVEAEYSEGEKRGKNKNGVKLMTLHQAKGLEFPYVFIIGVEEGILPHSRSIDDIFSLEEERRLFYVGITRAMKQLYITNARRRFMMGRRLESQKSRFIQKEEDVIDDWYV